MKKFYLLTLLVLIAVLPAFSQAANGTIKGTVTGNNKLIEAATITLFKAADKASAKMAVTNAKGQFELTTIAPGKYQVLISAIGFATSTIPVEVLEKNLVITLPEVKLSAASQALKEVTVVGKKQFVEQKLDRTLINVDASPTNTGLTALEVLEKSPGISVDRDGNISLKGKQGVLVMMDGKPTYLNGADLTNLLKNMPATQLEQIEIMPNPPAKYDAAGNSGIINIKTKKNKTQGRTVQTVTI
jgi:outer membrane receptor protein involved in Fe transport